MFWSLNKTFFDSCKTFKVFCKFSLCFTINSGSLIWSNNSPLWTSLYIFKYTLSLLTHYYIVDQEISNQLGNEIRNLVNRNLKILIHSFLHFLNQKTLSLVFVQLHSLVQLGAFLFFFFGFLLFILSKYILACLDDSLELLLQFYRGRNILLFIRGNSVVVLRPGIGVHNVLGIFSENHSHLAVHEVC